MKPEARCSSKNAWRASSSMGEREYIVPSGGDVPSSKSIFRSYSWWGATVKALLWLNTSANSWYSCGTPERSAGSEWVEAVHSSLSRGRELRLKETEPSSRQAFANAAWLTNSMEGAWQLDAIGISEVRVSGSEMEVGGDGGALGGVGLGCMEVRNVILLDTQSINGLWQVSQLCPRTMEQDPSNEVT
jgi:hypothetical protein